MPYQQLQVHRSHGKWWLFFVLFHFVSFCFVVCFFFWCVCVGGGGVSSCRSIIWSLIFRLPKPSTGATLHVFFLLFFFCKFQDRIQDLGLGGGGGALTGILNKNISCCISSLAGEASQKNNCISWRHESNDHSPSLAYGLAWLAGIGNLRKQWWIQRVQCLGAYTNLGAKCRR